MKQRPPKSEDIPTEKGVEFERGAPGFEIDGKAFWVRRITLRSARDFAAMVPVGDDISVVETQEAMLPLVKHLLRDANGDPPTDDQVLDGVSPRDAARFISFVFGTEDKDA
jgi:hypothetical protein